MTLSQTIRNSLNPHVIAERRRSKSRQRGPYGNNTADSEQQNTPLNKDLHSQSGSEAQPNTSPREQRSLLRSGSNTDDRDDDGNDSDSEDDNILLEHEAQSIIGGSVVSLSLENQRSYADADGKDNSDDEINSENEPADTSKSTVEQNQHLDLNPVKSGDAADGSHQSKSFSFALPFSIPTTFKEFRDLTITRPLTLISSQSSQSSNTPTDDQSATVHNHAVLQENVSTKKSHRKLLHLHKRHTVANEPLKASDLDHKKVSIIARPQFHRSATQESTDDETQYLNVHQMDNARFRAVKESIKSSISIDQINSLVFSAPKDNFPEIDGDVLVMGGYRGSILRDAKTRKRVWIPMKVGLNIRKINLEIGLSDEDEDNVANDIIADGMLTGIGPVDMARRLLKRLQQNANCRVHDYGYDWRLSPDRLSRELAAHLRKIKSESSDPSRGIIVIAHSMGGVIAHGAMQLDPSLFRGLIYVGAPSSSVNILGPFRYGENVLLSTKVLSAQVTFTMRSSYVFLPLDGRCFLNKNTGKDIILDFFDPKVWVKYGLSPCVTRHPQSNSNPSVEERNENAASKATKLTFDDVTTPASMSQPSSNGVQSTLPFDEAVEYLERTLASVKKYKRSLEFDPSKDYPPLAVVYGRKVPTVCGARVFGEKSIYEGDYSDMIFVPGDGVVASRNLMPPKGFSVCGRFRSDRGHVGLLGDIPRMGQALRAILDEESRRKQG